MNVEMFAQYIFSGISCTAIDVQKYDVSEKIDYLRANRIDSRMRKDVIARICV